MRSGEIAGAQGRLRGRSYLQLVRHDDRVAAVMRERREHFDGGAAHVEGRPLEAAPRVADQVGAELGHGDDGLDARLRGDEASWEIMGEHGRLWEIV